MRRVTLILLSIALLAPMAQAQETGTPETTEFFYSALWDTVEDDINYESVQRIPLALNEHSAARQAFIDGFVIGLQQLQAQPGGPGQGPAVGEGEEVEAPRVDIRLSLDPSVKEADRPLVYSFDPVSIQQALQEGNDLTILATWCFYYWQFDLWEYFVARETLLFPRKLTVSELDELVKNAQSQREPIWTWSEIDDGMPVQWYQASVDFPRIEPPTKRVVADSILGMRQAADALDGQMVAPQNPAIAKFESQAMVQTFGDAALGMDAKNHDRYFSLINRLRARQEQRENYYAWLRDRRDLVVEFARNWARRYDGQELTVDGVLFLVTKAEPMDDVPVNVRNIVVDEMVIPNDILNEDGALKRPEQSEY